MKEHLSSCGIHTLGTAERTASHRRKLIVFLHPNDMPGMPVEPDTMPV